MKCRFPSSLFFWYVMVIPPDSLLLVSLINYSCVHLSDMFGSSWLDKLYWFFRPWRSQKGFLVWIYVSPWYFVLIGDGIYVCRICLGVMLFDIQLYLCVPDCIGYDAFWQLVKSQMEEKLPIWWSSFDLEAKFFSFLIGMRAWVTATTRILSRLAVAKLCVAMELLLATFYCCNGLATPIF